MQICKTPEEAIDRLAALHGGALTALSNSLDNFLKTGRGPTSHERTAFRYPELRVTYHADGPRPDNPRAYAKFSSPGVYTTTITQPEEFRPYLMEQLSLLVNEYDATLEVGSSRSEIPYPYVLDGGDELGLGNVPPADLARHYPTPLLATVGDEIADGVWVQQPGAPKPLSLFDAPRVDFSLRRLVHYTGTDWRAFQPWILFTNYHRYVDEFVRYAIAEIRKGGRYTSLVACGGVVIDSTNCGDDAEARVANAAWRRHQMPAYHLRAAEGEGITLVNIGVGPSNAKNICDHLAVLRPHCWLMIGHCGGLRQSQRIGDYVLAHAYLRQDHILDRIVPPDIPIPAIAEVQTAMQEAAAVVTGDFGDALKRRLRTGTVVTYDDRNWELRFSQERRRIDQSRAIGVDMESGTIAAQGYRMRVPYGTLLCVSDKPLHGEIKLPGSANAFYERAIGEHLKIGIATVERLRAGDAVLHSRKLRSFDEPPFR